jgi:hypothetical protein
MSLTPVGAFITHSKLPELGIGEVLSTEKGSTRIRFAAGERRFVSEMVEPFLSVTLDRPPPPAAVAKARRAKRKTAPAVS